MSVPVEEILKARVDLTLVNGRVVYETGAPRTP
jgi:hypothetical protein